MASFYRLPSGLWRAQIARKGVRKSQTFHSKAAAQAWALAEEKGLLDGTAERWPGKTFADALTRYKREVTPTKRGHRAEAIMLDHTLSSFPDLCAIPIHKLTPADVAAWRDARLKEVSGSTVIRYAAVLRHVWAVAAKEWGWCPKDSPFSAIRLPEHNPPRERINNWREIRRMLRQLNYCTKRPPSSMTEEVAYAWLICLRTAMRAGEVLQVSPENTDLVSRVVTIKHHKTAKLTGRPRHIPISKQAARLIRLCPRFTVAATSVDTLFRRARAHAGLEGFTFHDSRATALTLLSRRVDILTLQRISGHRNLSELLTYYRESSASIAGRL